MDIGVLRRTGLALLLAVLPHGALLAADRGPGPEIEEFMITRDKETKAAKINIASPGPWRLYAGPAPGAVDFSRSVAAGDEAGRHPLPVDTTRRLYFVLERDGRHITLAERLLPMAGGYNFRDMGGMRAVDDRRVAWGRLLRSDGLGRLTEADLAYLDSVPVVTVVDFRNEHEAQRSPDKLPDSVRHHVHLAITPGNLEAGKPDVIFSKPADDAFMENLNRALVRDPAIQEQYRRFFRMVQSEEYLPLLFHCSAGKDRTGFAAALIQFALGVDKETIIQDYLASGRYLEGKYAHLVEKYPDQAVLFTVKRPFLEAAIAAMEEDYGSVERYLTEVLEVDPARMRRLFLE